MTAPMYTKIFQSIEENLYNLGYSGKAKRKWFGDIAAGASVKIGNTVPVAACLMNFTDASYPTANDLAFIAVMRQDEIAGLQWPKAMTSQLHAYDQFSQAGAFLVDIFLEAPVIAAGADPAAATIALLKFQNDVIHIFRGQWSAPVRINYSTNATPAAIATVDGKNQAAESAVTYTAGGVLLPYGRIATNTLA